MSDKEEFRGFHREKGLKDKRNLNELYSKLAYSDRNDAISMQYLIPNWKFDSKKPCMVR